MPWMITTACLPGCGRTLGAAAAAWTGDSAMALSPLDSLLQPYVVHREVFLVDPAGAASQLTCQVIDRFASPP
jgi:hypothetical protein